MPSSPPVCQAVAWQLMTTYPHHNIARLLQLSPAGLSAGLPGLTFTASIDPLPVMISDNNRHLDSLSIKTFHSSD